MLGMAQQWAVIDAKVALADFALSRRRLPNTVTLNLENTYTIRHSDVFLISNVL